MRIGKILLAITIASFISIVLVMCDTEYYLEFQLSADRNTTLQQSEQKAKNK